jgi:RND family efflux transporter MFP subunit
MGRFLDSVRLRKALTWAALVVGLLCVGVALSPALIQRMEAETNPTAVAESDPAWESATQDDLGGLGGAVLDDPGVAAVLTPNFGGDERIGQIDDSWLPATAAPEGKTDSTALACIIEPLHVVKIGSAVTGLIEKIHVERSDLVVAGQVLVELESGAERAAVLAARSRADMNEEIRSREASASLGKRRRDRVTQLYDQQTLSLDLRDEIETEAEVARFELGQARAEKKLASHQLDQAAALLMRRTIRSPITGIVVERLMSPGERVDEEVILTVAQIDPLGVEVILPSSAFGSIEVGMRAAVVPEFPGDTVHVAAVTIVDRLIDSASGTFGVRAELPNPDRRIPSGLHCQVQFLTE